MIFNDRSDAGQQLAKKLTRFKNKSTVILALVRGGVPIAYEIAKKLKLPMSVIVARKIGDPHNSEFGIGAISEADTIYLDRLTINRLSISKEIIDNIIKSEKKELKRRVEVYRQEKKLTILQNKIVILVDHGIATEVTIKATIKTIRKLKAKKIILAIPVAANDSLAKIAPLVDQYVCLHATENLSAIGQFYKDFSQTTDIEVIQLLTSNQPPSE